MKALFYNNWDNSYIPQILEEIYIKKVYMPFLTGKKDMIIADWGGNLGLTSQYFSKYASKVYCVEPSKAHHEVIEKLIEFNKIENIKLCKYAISNENGTTKFFHPENATMYSMENMMGVADYEEVETVDTETFMKREGIDHIDLLKFDCEGEESKIISSKSFEKSSDKIRVIVGEWHSWTQMSKDAFANRFRDLGFEFKWYMNTEASVFSCVKI